MWQLSFLDIKKYYLVLALFVVISSIQCQNVVNVEPKFIEKTEGDSVEILCSYGTSIQRCRFELRESNLEVKLHPEVQRVEPFHYFGEGLNKGQCGLRISKLERAHEGNWTCRLDLGDAFDDVVGHTEIVIARAPQQPQLIIQEQNRLREGEELYADCSFLDGRPSAIVRWFLGTEEITTHDESSTEQNGTAVITSSFRRILRADDNLKSLICRVEHPAFENSYTNTTYQLNVNYPPQALDRNQLHIGGLIIGSSADIAITIRSNPQPSLEWTIDGIKMMEGVQNKRFVVKKAERVDESKYRAQLTVVELTLEDTLKTYNLRASNEYGVQDYQIRIGGSPDEHASGLGIVAIIGLAIAALVVLVIISLLVVARITKRWCFAGASMHPNSPDSEAQIAPDEDKTHEQYEQHDSKVSDEESGVIVESIKATNGKSNGNTSV